MFDGNFRGKTKTYDFQTPQSVEIDFSGKWGNLAKLSCAIEIDFSGKLCNQTPQSIE